MSVVIFEVTKLIFVAWNIRTINSCDAYFAPEKKFCGKVGRNRARKPYALRKNVIGTVLGSLKARPRLARLASNNQKNIYPKNTISNNTLLKPCIKIAKVRGVDSQHARRRERLALHLWAVDFERQTGWVSLAVFPGLLDPFIDITVSSRRVSINCFIPCGIADVGWGCRRGIC